VVCILSGALSCALLLYKYTVNSSERSIDFMSNKLSFDKCSKSKLRGKNGL
jgi:hypothetical protein